MQLNMSEGLQKVHKVDQMAARDPKIIVALCMSRMIVEVKLSLYLFNSHTMKMDEGVKAYI
jgi:hypothetical protein